MSLYTIKSGASAIPEIILLQLLALCLDGAGVKSLSDEDHFLVSENSGGADMQVEVAPGAAAVIKGNKSYPILSDDTEVVTIGNNASGQARIDAIVLHVDVEEAPNTDATDVAKLTVVPGTPAGSPVAPNAAAIESAIGASDPYIVLAHVAVVNGASSITNANITDVRQALRLKGEPETDWTFITGDGVDPNEQVSVTFDREYAEPPTVQVMVVGFKDGSDPADKADATITSGYVAYAGSVTETGFTIGVTHKDTTPIVNNRRVLVHWMAIGRLAN